MATPKQEFLTPVGRLVQGDPMEKQTQDMQGNALTIKTGAQAGQPTQRYFCAVAFPKLNAQGQPNPEFGAFYALLVQEARKSFPHLFDAQGNCTNPRFAWKYVDGDSTVPDDGGRAPNTKEGFPGHWVVKFSSSFPPRCFNVGMYQPHEQITNPNLIRRGYYVRISGTIEGNGNAQKPGLYVNLSMVELSGQGPEITSGPDANAVFGSKPGALPPGATALPAPGMPQQPAPPGYPQAPAPMAAPGMQAAVPGLGAPGAPAPATYTHVAPPPVPGMPVQPHAGFAAGAVPGLSAPPPAPGMMAPPAPPMAPAGPPAGPQKTATWPAGFSYEQMLGANWTDATLRGAGYIV